MPSLNLILAFSCAARHESFANAARELGITPSAVAKNIASLEAQLGVRLFHRTTRRVSLSPDGEDLYARCQRIVEEVEALEASAMETRNDVRGTLTIDMPVTYGRQIILPVLCRLQSRHPGLRIDARFSDQVIDVVKEGIDAVIRIGSLEDSTLIGRKFDEQVIWTCASPDYLKKHGKPKIPDDLARHNCLSFRLPSKGRDRLWQFQDGAKAITFSPKGDVRLGDGEALVCAAEIGMGIVQIPSHMARSAVAQGTLMEILEKYRPTPMPIMLLYPSRRHVAPRLRALLSALGEI